MCSKRSAAEELFVFEIFMSSPSVLVCERRYSSTIKSCHSDYFLLQQHSKSDNQINQGSIPFEVSQFKTCINIGTTCYVLLSLNNYIYMHTTIVNTQMNVTV